QDKWLLVGGKLNAAGAPPRYRKEFRQRGLDLENGMLAELARRVKQSAIQEQLLAALDEWAAIDARMRKRLRGVTVRADPNPIRQAMHGGDQQQLFRLADELAVGRYHPATLLTLGLELKRAGGDPVKLWRRALQRYPQDFWLNFILGNTLYKQRN